MDLFTQIITAADRANIDRACKACGQTYRATRESQREAQRTMNEILHQEARNSLDTLRQVAGLGRSS